MTISNDCPEWCHLKHDDGPGDDQHFHYLWFNWLPINNGAWAHRLWISSSDDRSPAMVLEQFGSEIPRSISAKAARELAAALLRGAEIVEADYEECAVCDDEVPSSHIDPESEGHGACIGCILKEEKRKRDLVRSELSVVPS